MIEELTIAFKDIQPGDLVETPDGRWVPVEQVYDGHLPERMFELTMEDGQVVRASGNHLHYSLTRADREGFREYKKLGRKLFKSLPSKVKADCETVMGDETTRYEIDFDNLLLVLGVKGVEEFYPLIVRLCESVGPIAENTYNDDVQPIPQYDAARVFRQLYALGGDKRWTPLVGRVRTTLQLLDEDDVEI